MFCGSAGQHANRWGVRVLIGELRHAARLNSSLWGFLRSVHVFRYHQWSRETLRGLDMFVDHQWSASVDVRSQRRDQRILDNIGEPTRSSFVVRSIVVFEFGVWLASGFRGAG